MPGKAREIAANFPTIPQHVIRAEADMYRFFAKSRSHRAAIARWSFFSLATRTLTAFSVDQVTVLPARIARGFFSFHECGR